MTTYMKIQCQLLPGTYQYSNYLKNSVLCFIMKLLTCVKVCIV